MRRVKAHVLRCHCSLCPLLLGTESLHLPSGGLSRNGCPIWWAHWLRSELSLREPGCYGGWCPELQVGERRRTWGQPESYPSQRESDWPRKSLSQPDPPWSQPLSHGVVMLASLPPPSGWELQQHPISFHLCHPQSLCRWCHVYPMGGESPRIIIPVAVTSLASAIHLPFCLTPVPNSSRLWHILPMLVYNTVYCLFTISISTWWKPMGSCNLHSKLIRSVYNEPCTVWGVINSLNPHSSPVK